MKTLWTILILILGVATLASAQTPFYSPIGTTKYPFLYVTQDPNDPGSSKVPGADFWVFFDSGLKVIDPADNLQVAPLDTLKTSNDATATRPLRISSDVPVASQRLGMYRSEADALAGNNLSVLALYTFYAPTVVFLNASNDTIKAGTTLTAGVNDNTPVKAVLVIPVGPDAGDTLKANWTFDLTGSAGIKFMKALPVSATDTLTLNKLVFIDGVASFNLRGSQAVQLGAVTYSGYPAGSTSAYRLTGSFPASLNINNPDFPALDSAVIYDTDGDGKGDKITGYFTSGLDKVNESMTLSSNWPNNGTLATLSGTVTKDNANDSVSISGLKLAAQTLNPAAGEFKVDMVSSVSGVTGSTQAPIKDRIGPVIQAVTILPGFNGAPDTLIAVFNKELDTASVTPGQMLLVNGSAVQVDSAGPAGERTWIFVLADGKVEAGDSLQVNVLGSILADDGNKPSYNKPALITDAGRVPRVSENGNGFFDADADGRMDSVVVQFAETITQGQLDAVDFRFVWKDSTGTPFELRPPADQLVLGADGKTVSWAFNADSFNIMPYLTSIESRDYGYAALISTYQLNGAESGDTLMVKMADRMAPVLVSSFLRPESSNKNAPDKLTLEFSEAVNGSALTNLDYIEFEVDGVNTRFELDDPRWSTDGRTLDLKLAQGATLSSRPNPADSLKISMVAGGIQDLHGNAVGASAPQILLEGDPRILVETANMIEVDRDDIGVDETPVTEKFYEDNTQLSEVMGTSLGILLDIGQATIPDDSTGELDLDKIGMNWELFVYTSSGAYVAGSNSEIRCNDPGFNGNCFENRKKIYLRWNMLSEDGRKAGVGVYLAKVRIKVYGQKNSHTIEKIFTWGVSGTAGRTIR